MRGYRIVAIRLICVLVAVAGALLSPPAVAEPLPFDTLCHSVTGTGTADSALPTLPFACRGAPAGYQYGSLWLCADLRTLPVDRCATARTLGRASRRERVWSSAYISVGGGC